MCNVAGTNQGAAPYPEGTEAVFSEDSKASATSFDATSIAQMDEATARIGFTLLYNDATRPGWAAARSANSWLIVLLDIAGLRTRASNARGYAWRLGASRRARRGRLSGWTRASTDSPARPRGSCPPAPRWPAAWRWR